MEAGKVEAGPSRARQTIGQAPLPTIVAAAILVIALVAAFAFTALRGGIDLAAAPGGTATPAATVASSSSGSPPAATVAPASPAASPPSSAAPTPTVTPSASPAPTATVAPTTSPVPTPGATPGDPRYAGLRTCPGQPDCYLYVVQRGDTLSSIAAFFGVPLRDIRDLNEDIANPSIIHVGQRIRVPGPG
ncbi:MAG: LysM peptidoglycan-binding domain-containing protein [Chloroflexi bacterium]|nr:LysM peptidoglycan-binding domain-containing protein [Chloroflexota bacterium]